jgi:hypothetical protein
MWSVYPLLKKPKIYAKRGSVEKVDLYEAAKVAELGEICANLLSRQNK